MTDTALDTLLEAVRELTDVVDRFLTSEGYQRDTVKMNSMFSIKAKLDALIKLRRGRPDDVPAKQARDEAGK